MRWVGTLFLLAEVALAGCDGCRKPTVPTTSPANGGDVASVRLFLVSDLAGALEPCGCVKDQLGGMDHFGALVLGSGGAGDGGAGKTDAARVVLSAGPLFFMGKDLEPDKRGQEVAKAKAIATSLKALDLGAFAPGRNDWADGASTLTTLAKESGADLVAANRPDLTRWAVKTVGPIKLGVIGVAPSDATDGGAAEAAFEQSVQEGAKAVKAEGAQAIVVLASVGRGAAKRLADAMPELLAVVVGSAETSGDANTAPAPVEQVGHVLIVEAANHLQTTAEVDLFIRDPKPELLSFADATGIERTRKREALQKRIDELRTKLAEWEKDKSIDPRDVAARKADVTKLEAERDALTDTPPPATGNFYRYAMRDVREDLGSSAPIKAIMLDYYKTVNAQNKAAFADKKPPPVPKGEAGYVGIDTCTNCHDEPRAVWDKTAHAHAYATLADQFKEYNLDCVSCHVTGYDRPGGSTVTHVDELKNVQCEVCHGPGSLHATAKKPESVKVPIPKPSGDVCLACHHPPHVHTFDPKAKMAEILGPGHGKPKP